jgi:hypothetical protein
MRFHGHSKMMKSKDLDFDFMVDYRPRDTLTEGRGW